MRRQYLSCLLSIHFLIHHAQCLAFLSSHDWHANKYRIRGADGIVVSLAKNPEADDGRSIDAPSVDPASSTPRDTPFPMLQWNVSSILNINNNTAYHVYLRQVYRDALNVLETTEDITSFEYGHPTPSSGNRSIPFQQIKRFLQSYSHDRNHHGRFVVPIEQRGDHDSNRRGYSMPANLAFSMNEPLLHPR